MNAGLGANATAASKAMKAVIIATNFIFQYIVLVMEDNTLLSGLG